MISNMYDNKKFEFTIFIVFWLMLIVIASMSLLGHGADYANYVALVVNKIDLTGGTSEVAFTVLIWVNDIFFNSAFTSFLLMFAILGVGVKLVALYKYSKIPLLSLYIYIFSYFLLHEYVQIRAGVAAGIFLLAVVDLSVNNLKKYLVKVTLAILFHWSSVVLLPLYFVIRYAKNGLFYFLPFVGLFVFFTGLGKNFSILEILAPVALFSNYYQAHSGYQEEVNAINLVSTSHLFLFVIFTLVFTTRKKIINEFDLVTYKIFSTSLFLFYLLAALQLPVMAFRLSEYLNVVLLFLIPAIVSNFKNKIFPIIFITFYFMAYIYHLIVNVKIISAGIL